MLQGTCPFKFPPDQSLIQNTNRILNWEFFKTTLFTIYVTVLCMQLIQQTENEPLTTWIQSYLFAVADCGYNFSKWVMFARRQMFVELFNGLVLFKKRHLNTKDRW